MDGLHDTADGTAFDRHGDDSLGLDTEDVEAVAGPVEAGVGKNDAEAEERHNVGDAGVVGISDGSLDRAEDGCARDTHDEDTGATAGVRAKVGGTEGEEGRVLKAC